jgi:hypothetical protein
MHQSTCRFIGGCAVLFDEGDRRKKSFQDALDHRGIFVDQIIAREDQVRMKMRREALRFDFAALNGFGRLCDSPFVRPDSNSQSETHPHRQTGSCLLRSARPRLSTKRVFCAIFLTMSILGMKEGAPAFCDQC